MSSRRNAAGKPPAGPPPERKAPAGPVITPQVLMVVYFLLVAIAVGVYWNSVIKANQEKQAAADSRAKAAQANISTYKKKGAKLEIARRLNKTVGEKLKDTAYMFLTDQSSVIPFWTEVFWPVVMETGRFSFVDESALKADKYAFKINMAMNPFNTVPPSQFFENIQDFFPIQYEPEQNGTPTEVPLDTRPSDFLTPYNIKLIKFVGTYEDVKKFVRDLQLRQNKTLFTVHCMKNFEDTNGYGYRTFTQWDIALTVYFINPEAAANGDTPPGLPGSSSC
jgi:hypothetical protein